MEKRNYGKIANKTGIEETNEVLEMVQDTFSPPTDSDNMIFNKNYYKAKKEVSFELILLFFLLFQHFEFNLDCFRLKLLKICNLR
jgi:hypothetical protein